ncbi:hypothetical protein [Streptomyces nigrescens]|uniref:hypothetical protein n=1 Tax=Streptomyces nigrescens TaxID=1920 RepID=UPI0027E42682|nr:hypothetical protein [Streptomyces libani]
MRGEQGREFVEVATQGIGLRKDGHGRVRQRGVGGGLAQPSASSRSVRRAGSARIMPA